MGALEDLPFPIAKYAIRAWREAKVGGHRTGVQSLTLLARCLGMPGPESVESKCAGYRTDSGNEKTTWESSNSIKV